MHSLYFYTLLLITTALAASSPHRRLISNRVAILPKRDVMEMSSTDVAGMAANMTATNATVAANATENAAGGNNTMGASMQGEMNNGMGNGMGGNNKMQGKHKKGGNKFKTAKMKDMNGNVVTVIIIA